MQLPFAIIEDGAPEAMRIPSWMAHPNSVRSIATLHLRTFDLPRTVAELSAISPDATVPTFSGTASYAMGNVTLALHEAPTDMFLQEVSAVIPGRKGPSLLALEFGATDLSAAADCLKTSGLRFSAYSEWLAVHATEGFGCGIIIRQTQGVGN